MGNRVASFCSNRCLPWPAPVGQVRRKRSPGLSIEFASGTGSVWKEDVKRIEALSYVPKPSPSANRHYHRTKLRRGYRRIVIFGNPAFKVVGNDKRGNSTEELDHPRVTPKPGSQGIVRKRPRQIKLRALLCFPVCGSVIATVCPGRPQSTSPLPHRLGADSRTGSSCNNRPRDGVRRTPPRAVV